MTEYKGFNIKGDGTFGYKEIHRKGAGTLPKQLGGVFTTATVAQREIDRYLAEKEAKDGSKSSTAGS